MSASWRGRAGVIAVAVTGALGAFAGQAAAQTTYEPGVTLRTYQFASQPSAVCTLKSGQTPNVDKLMSTINWTTEAEFGANDNFQSTVLARLTTPAAGEYSFRLTSDDGSILKIDDAVVVDHDGLHGDTSKEAAVTLTQGVHNLRIDYIEATNGQVLKLEWKTPGSSSYVVVPSSVLSTEAGVVRVTAPGSKYCEGATDTAGDGLRLDAVNPNYTLTDIRPTSFQPKVSGMDFLPDGRMVLTTTGDVSSGGWVPNPESSEVYVLDKVTGSTTKDQVTYTKVAGNLKNTMGIQIVDGRWYVSEREGLTELLPDGDDADTLMDHKRLASWPNGGNFHEFAFGLIHDDDYFYVARSVAINNGGATTDPQPGTTPGTAIKIDRKTWQVSTVAGGLRTPNGIGFGPEGGIFVNDNQGAWLPSNKMVQIKQGRFFNHFTNFANGGHGPFDDQPVTAPVLWMPQNEIANSPSNPVMLTEGPFKGQMIWGDVTYGGLQRGFLEKVDGEFQGAVFRHSAGLEVGVNRTVIGPDGAIYVGGTGEGGNWGEDSKLRYGLQKLTPNGKNVFDMEKMEVIEGGFKISYTQPVGDAAIAKLKDAYKFKQWRYVPTSQYGGPKVDEEGLLVSDASISADKKTVTIHVDGLKPGRVVHVRSQRPFASGTGEELWNTEAWYTLNSLPGYEAPAATGFYEAEEGQIAGGANIQTEHSGYSGSGFVGGFFNSGANFTMQVSVDADGTYPVNVRYANGPNPSTKDKSVAFYVNGVKQPNWVFPTTSTADWKAWAFSTKNLELKKGINQIKFGFESGTDGNVNFDALKVGESKDVCAPATLEPGYVGLFDGTLDSLTKWRMAGPGSFGRQADCSIRGEGGLGLNWYTSKQFTNYSLKLDWKMTKDDNGGVFVGFPNPGNDPWVAVNNGYEIQIDETDELDRVTGSIYTFKGADRAKVLANLKPLGQWNAYEILVQGDNIKIFLNGVEVNDWTITDKARDLAGFIGLQNHGAGEFVSYRNVRIKEGIIDNVVPTITGTLDPAAPGADGTYDRPVTLTLAAQDDKPGTVAVEYRVNGGAWTAYTGPLTVSTLGEHTIEYRATDAAGNVSEIGSKTVKIKATTTETDHEIVGSVPATLSVQLGGQTSLGTFIPAVARDYTATTTATVVSTAGQAQLTVSDPSTANTGHLVNGTHALAQPLQVRAGTGAFAGIGGSAAPTSLLSFGDPVSGTEVPLEFKQSIGDKDGLRTGQYSKTLTFTLSTTTP